ncbi:MAG: hypothetical protein HQK75_10340 [Candidatus Magnetomorum sp.]|nr:hypothetical protein [Candidatus Magnetomorum sp.]
MPRIQIVYIYVMILLQIVISDVSAYSFEDIQIHGFVSQGFMISDRNNYLANTEEGTFEFNEAGINFSKNFTENFHMGCQFFARDIGDVGNDEIELDFALADFRLKDSLGFRIGKIKIPHGLYNDIRDVDMLRTFIFLPPVYYDISRSTINAMNGIGLYGNYQFSTMGNIEYQIIGGSKSIDPESGWSRYMERRGIDITQFDIGYIGCGSMIWNPPVNGLRLGMTGIRLDMAADAEIEFFPLPPAYAVSGGPDLKYELNDLMIKVNFIEYTLNDLILAFEYMTFRGDLSLATLSPNPPLVFKIPVRTDTYYLSMTYRLSDILEVGGYYAVFWPDSDDKHGKTLAYDYLGWHKETAFCLRFDINDALAFKTEMHLIDGGSLMMPQDNPEGVDQRCALFLLKLTFSF